jgi:hypothetical protein
MGFRRPRAAANDDIRHALNYKAVSKRPWLGFVDDPTTAWSGFGERFARDRARRIRGAGGCASSLNKRAAVHAAQVQWGNHRRSATAPLTMDWMPAFAHRAARTRTRRYRGDAGGLLLVAWFGQLDHPPRTAALASKAGQASPMQWDGTLLARGVLSRLAHAVTGADHQRGHPGGSRLHTITPCDPQRCPGYIYKPSRCRSATCSTANDLHTNAAAAVRQRPIKNYVQVGRLVVFLVPCLSAATLIDRSP